MAERFNVAARIVAQNMPNYPGREVAEGFVNSVFGDVLKKYTGRSTQRLLGFWVLVHAYGSWEALRDSGLLSTGGVYTTRKEFQMVFGVDVEDFLADIAKAIHTADGR